MIVLGNASELEIKPLVFRMLLNSDGVLEIGRDVVLCLYRY